MSRQLNTEKIRKLAKALDDAIENRDSEGLISYFSDDCVIELPGIKLSGIDGLQRAIAWMYRYLGEITLIPITIMVDKNTFFEVFYVKTKLRNGKEIQVKQAEVLVYDNDYKVASLHLYFDRLELAAAYVANPIEKILVDWVSRASQRGLI